ncbi:KOW domain-containing RNA-binding protein [Neobacillus sp. PS3-34]|uniref:KOW domain-containing RNA-binding protein n=1 Tax=Neobacillus sp. PS3-34 TaxID=3070678 RepID=UPI0027DF3D14|nr:KOW domain-containing RNA-binding protein [Neobacillus sp. PS3-34]WML50275.1 KOW domain-containing RNA-binding protein [Neobacillus sp. PS3-34]
MAVVDSGPKLGQFVLVSRGRDAGQYAIIVRLIDERFVFLADGVKRKFDQPKKKNIQHLRLFDQVSPEVHNSIIETGRVTNGKIRFALTIFLNKRLSEKEKGDQFDGER